MIGNRDQNASGMTRRMVLKSTGAAVAVTVLGVPGWADKAQGCVPNSSSSGKPGIARERIEGRAKVTGQKVYARDFRARDMAGWPANEWHALYLMAGRVDAPFEGVDLRALPPEAAPKHVVLGSQLHQSMRAPKLRHSRDLLVGALEEEHNKGRSDGSFDRPGGLEYDLMVQPGNVPDFYGQAIALLLFDKQKAYKAAKDILQFQNEKFVVYGAAEAPKSDAPAPGQPYSPQTEYVKYLDEFSFAQTTYSDYKSQVDAYRQKVTAALQSPNSAYTQPINVQTQAMDPMFMEPEAGLAWMDSAGNLSLVLGTQSPDGDVRNIGAMFDAPDAPRKLNGVTLHSCYPGGGFGGRDSSPFTLLLAIAAAFTECAPVRLAYDRFEQFQVGLKRHAADLTGNLYMNKDLTIRGLTLDMKFDGGGRRNLSPYVASLAGLCAGGAYSIPMADIRSEAIHTQNIPGGSQRGFGGPQAFFALETALDDVARVVQVDPFLLRRINLLPHDQRTVVGGQMTQLQRMDDLLTKAEQHPLWADRVALKQQYSSADRLYGTGMAMSFQAYGTSGDGMVASIHLSECGGWEVRSDAVDMGNGSATTLGVVIGPLLGSNAHSVKMGDNTLFDRLQMTVGGHGDWSQPYWTRKGVGSSSACLTGFHHVETIRELARAVFVTVVLPAAWNIWGNRYHPDQVELLGGSVVHKEGAQAPITLQDIARDRYATQSAIGAVGHGFYQGSWAAGEFNHMRLNLDGMSLVYPHGRLEKLPRVNGTGPDQNKSRESRFGWSPCANVVALSVEKATGRVQIENVLSVLDAGHIHVPQLVSGQSQGGVAMAIGYSLMEDVLPGSTGPANGTWNLNRYHVPRMRDVPVHGEIASPIQPGHRGQTLITLDPDPNDPRRTGRGIAEAVMCSIPPAISNALYDATNMRYSTLPITPAQILEGLQA